MSMVLSHITALELYRSSMMPVSGYEKVSFLSLSVPTRNDVECYRALPIRTSHIPLHCVVPKPRDRRNIKNGHCHVFGGERTQFVCIEARMNLPSVSFRLRCCFWKWPRSFQGLNW